MVRGRSRAGCSLSCSIDLTTQMPSPPELDPRTQRVQHEETGSARGRHEENGAPRVQHQETRTLRVPHEETRALRVTHEETRTLRVRGARTHNLKNIDLDIPKYALVV